ncbi:unnamed protein product [Callosobruchus maculatus]|uniref:Helicase C-terminal domain-containing protein n=1 Tax=Callosobruchus maculatus TaxID=64391 RepID=A0A653CHT2_CALMS|nr:unnamed protein product [Callosobruchus maculatus]
MHLICSNKQEKYSAVTNIYGTVGVGQAIIFCHTRRTAAWLSERMSKDGHAVAVLSGDLTVEQRINVLDRFREGVRRCSLQQTYFQEELTWSRLPS